LALLSSGFGVGVGFEQSEELRPALFDKTGVFLGIGAITFEIAIFE